MSASIQPLTLEEFLAWERAQPHRYEFDGVQPIGPVGRAAGSSNHERLIARLIIATGTRIADPCETFASGLKVLADGKVRYPDVTIACGQPETDTDTTSPTIVFEVLSPSTTLTDRRVKAVEYSNIPSVLAYVILSQDEPEVWIRRRKNNWLEETLTGRTAILPLPEIGISIPLQEIYR